MQPMNNDALIMPYDLPRPGFCRARELLLVAGLGSNVFFFPDCGLLLFVCIMLAHSFQKAFL